MNKADNSVYSLVAGWLCKLIWILQAQKNQYGPESKW